MTNCLLLSRQSSTTGFQCQQLDSDFACSLISYGLAESRFVISGGYKLFGIDIKLVPGNDLKKKANHILSMTVKGIADMAKECGFIAELAPGSIIASPPGFILVSMVKGPTETVSWNTYRAPEKKCVVESLEMLLQSYPQLATTEYKKLHDLIAA